MTRPLLIAALCALAAAGAAPSASPATVTPKPGTWTLTNVAGLMSRQQGFGDIRIWSAGFTVSASHATVSRFRFEYDAYGATNPGAIGSCGARNYTSSELAPSPIANGRFASPAHAVWTYPGTSATYQGTFDSPTAAHGTVSFSVLITGSACAFSGTAKTRTVPWKATWTKS